MNRVQTSPISSIGYTSNSVPAAAGITQSYIITGLIPYTNYTVHVQAVVDPIADRNEIFGDIRVELPIRTLSAPDNDIPVAPPTTVPTLSPTKNQIVIRIGDPTLIDTGRVM